MMDETMVVNTISRIFFLVVKAEFGFGLATEVLHDEFDVHSCGFPLTLCILLAPQH